MATEQLLRPDTEVFERSDAINVPVVPSTHSATVRPEIRNVRGWVDGQDVRHLAERIADACLVILSHSENVVGQRDRDASVDAGFAFPQARALHDAGRFLTTVLMTDIVDSTHTVSRLGDRGWRDLLADHYAACRELVGDGGGEVVSTTGDGIVASFDGPTRAVRAAIAIQAAARASGIAVRAGVHTGECERMPDGLAGVAVHIAARICALAGADEVLATGTVRDVVIGSLLGFEARGRHELRGVPGDWTVFAVTDLE